ncbi:50S ribosomal protein L29 [Candidatus Amesbacteria bacterium RIFOXYB1_FULL_44_23]|uniref:Large ribosomal subunit protein uL29 n=1 Tax=Candidatus Amesbacteria bacterium RIFOXYB1_FULL_44_23 TaxID=1797263 RepID=A0A1F4ZV04_9BACT|nr:MAG: 50S ribosomal protein L29 [Candidatus Amesbacteria bacterium RIFOXYB1_FULL_44_23]
MKQTEKKSKKTEVKISLADMTVTELISKSKQLYAEISKKKLEQKVGRLKNIREVFNLRKELARVKTILHIKMKLNSVKS